MHKLHYLRDGRYGLYSNLMTYCGASGSYYYDVAIRHYATGYIYNYTNDKERVTCKTCRRLLMPNPSEMQRALEEEQAELKRYIPKSDKERILRRIRKLERELGVTPRNYNGNGGEYV